MAEQTMCETSTFGVADVRTLKLLLTSPEPPVCIAALDALTKYAEAASKHRVQLLSLKTLDPLLALSKSTDAAVKKSAVACIAASTELMDVSGAKANHGTQIAADFHPELRRADLMQTLISLLAVHEPPEAQDEAAFGLSNLAKDFANKNEIRKNGGIKALVLLLDSPDPDVKKSAAYALSAMLDDFSSRTEVRYVHGLASLLNLLASEYWEVQENALNCLIRCGEDPGNRVEIRQLNGIRRLVDFLGQDVPELHHLALLCLANCIEETETCNMLFEIGGISALAKQLAAEDPKAKRNAALAIARAAKHERNQLYIRDAGALPTLVANLSHPDALTCSHAAIALAELGKNEINQLELQKLNALEVLIRNLGHEDLDVPRQSIAAISSLCLSAKIRVKARQTDLIAAALRLLGLEDISTLTNTCECVANFGEDSGARSDLIKANAVHSLVMVIQRVDHKLQSVGAMALARLMQDADGRIALTREPQERGLNRLIELIGSKDLNVCKNAAYALSNSAQNDLAAKYWLQNKLSANNQIADGFYDLGSAGTNATALHQFPLLQDLKDSPVDKRREILLLDAGNDPHLAALVALANEGPLFSRSSRQQIRQIASIVAQALGGAIDRSKLPDLPYKFKLTELKLALGSNVLPLGQVAHGTFYHRALLFKYLCDKVGLAPCALVRGEYGRAWNVVDVSRQSVLPPRGASTPATPVAPSSATPAKHEKQAKSARSREAAGGGAGSGSGAGGAGGAGAINASAGASVSGTSGAGPAPAGGLVGTAAAQGGAAAVASPPPPLPPATLVPVVVPPIVEDLDEMPEEETLVDLMFEPGRLMLVGSAEADAYQRLC
ncbi:Armadillo repeat-containing protein 3 [Geranomyces michiganensis]|nr:Armadillo repeat-containing protein 3 [Geranomyces michiganensis]